jgi:Ca2+-binding RTX toxin-like protein
MEFLFLLPLLLLAGLFTDGGSAGDENDAPLTHGATNGDDDVVGTDVAEVIATGDGADRILGEGGDDTLRSGAGDDVVASGVGDDEVYLGAGADFYTPNYEQLNGEFIIPDGGNDTVYGEAGSDALFDEFGSDVFYGGAGNDGLLSVDDGTSPTERDTMYGGAGDDTIGGDDGDRLYGGEGDDTFVLRVAETDRGDQWIRIYDFDPTTEIIEAEVLYGPDLPVVTFEPGANGGTRLLINGTNFAVIEGVPPEMLTLANVNAVRMA